VNIKDGVLQIAGGLELPNAAEKRSVEKLLSGISSDKKWSPPTKLTLDAMSVCPDENQPVPKVPESSTVKLTKSIWQLSGLQVSLTSRRKLPVK